MSDYKTIRGKFVRHDDVEIEVDGDGAVHIVVDIRHPDAVQRLSVSEKQFSRLYGLMQDVSEWQSDSSMKDSETTDA